MSYAKSERRDSWRYTVEPGVDECRSKLNPGTNGGGIGSLDSMGTKYYDFYQGADRPGSLIHFLSTLTTVEDDVTYYCATSYNAIKSYVTSFLSTYIPASKARLIVERCEQHSRTHSHDEEAFFLRRTIAVGTRFFNEIFYETAWEVAQELFPSPLLMKCTGQLENKYWGYSQLPGWKLFVNEFDSDSYEFELSKANNEVCIPNERRKFIGTPWHIECSERDFEKSFKPYIYFLSNWTLMLLFLLAGEKFGQCAFGVYWETGTLAWLQSSRRR